jgi:peptidoglycan/xylan/chitin deacetylase (PgdA/CDA1 family)
LTSGVAKPDGTPGNLQVLDWAGFKGALSFTFDDAMQSQITHYDELNAVGVPMTFYLVGGNDGGKAIWRTAAEDGHELGNHTMHHCNASGVQSTCGWGLFSNIDAEIDDCTAHMKSAFGVKGVYSFASPGGDSNWDIPASTRFLVSRGVYDDPAGVAPNGSTNPFELPCHLAATGETAAPLVPPPVPAKPAFNLVTDSVRTNGSWRIILNHSFGGDGGYHPVDIAEVLAAMNYAKDFGDVWIDTVTSIGAYWRAQAMLTAEDAATAGDDQVYTWELPANFPPGQFLRVTVDGGTLTQCGTELTWDDHGYYEVALDAGSLTISP